MFYFKVPISPAPSPLSAYDISRQTVWHSADDRNIIIIILEGKCSFTILGETMILEKGNLLLIPAGQEYHRRPFNNQSCRFAYIHFTTAKEFELIEYAEFESGLNCLDDETSADVKYFFLPQVFDAAKELDSISMLLNLVIRQHKYANSINKLSASLALTQLLAITQKEVIKAHALSAGNIPTDMNASLRKAVKYIHLHIYDRITLSTLCDLTNVSPQHLIRLFKDRLHMSPVEYINHVKISHAIQLLGQSNLTVEEIAYKLGFSNPSYFSRVFRKHNGNAPNEERDRIRNYVPPEQ